MPGFSSPVIATVLVALLFAGCTTAPAPVTSVAPVAPATPAAPVAPPALVVTSAPMAPAAPVHEEVTTHGEWVWIKRPPGDSVRAYLAYPEKSDKAPAVSCPWRTSRPQPSRGSMRSRAAISSRKRPSGSKFSKNHSTGFAVGRSRWVRVPSGNIGESGKRSQRLSYSKLQVPLSTLRSPTRIPPAITRHRLIQAQRAGRPEFRFQSARTPREPTQCAPSVFLARLR